MDNPNTEVLNQIKKLVKTSIAEMRPLVIVTEGEHSKHYSLAPDNEATKDFFVFTTLEGQRLLAPWNCVTYVGILPPIEVGAGRTKAATAR